MRKRKKKPGMNKYFVKQKQKKLNKNTEKTKSNKCKKGKGKSPRNEEERRVRVPLFFFLVFFFWGVPFRQSGWAGFSHRLPLVQLNACRRRFQKQHVVEALLVRLVARFKKRVGTANRTGLINATLFLGQWG